MHLRTVYFSHPPSVFFISATPLVPIAGIEKEIREGPIRVMSHPEDIGLKYFEIDIGNTVLYLYEYLSLGSRSRDRQEMFVVS